MATLVHTRLKSCFSSEKDRETVLLPQQGSTGGEQSCGRGGPSTEGKGSNWVCQAGHDPESKAQRSVEEGSRPGVDSAPEIKMHRRKATRRLPKGAGFVVQW